MPKITELDSVISLDGNDVLPVVSKNNNNEDETMKVAINLIGNKLLNSNEYGALNTTDKKIIGAINEVNTKASQFDNMTATATGSIATFDNGGDDIPVSEYECAIVAQQASGTPTPTDPLPITGFSQADITVTDNDQIINLYTVAFGQTIYGGRLIYKNGEWSIEATQKYYSYTEVLYYGTYGSDNANLYYMEISNYTTEKIKNISNATYTGVLLSNMLSKITTASVSDMKNNEIRTQGNATPRYFYFRADSFASLADLNAVLANTPLQVVAELETPIIIPITSATRVKTISGDNNIYSNTGDNTVKYFTKNADSLAELIKAFVL